MKRFSEFVLKARWFIIAIVLAVSIFLGFQIRNIKINSDVISSLPNDKDAVLLKQIGEQFGETALEW
jgi:uncharacterized protein